MIEFVSTDITELEAECINTVETLLERKLARADPLRIFILGLVSIICQQRELINFAANQNLLAFSSGEYLEKLGEFYGIERLPATKAETTVEVELSAARLQPTIITAGTRITADSKVFFSLDEDVIFAAGETIKTCAATCLSEGEIGNGYSPGEISKIVDPQPFLKSIVNITTSELGADIESDDSLRERIQLAPESFSVAGSRGAYEFWAKSTSALIADVAVDSPNPGEVNVYVLMKDGGIPSTEMIDAVQEKLSADTVRPLTDNVSVLPAQVVDYNLDVAYWISRENVTNAAQIIDAATAAVDEYVQYQSSRLGLDLNPSVLINKLMNAGVKRVVVNSPVFTVLNSHQVAVPSAVNIVFSGLEDF